MMREMRNGGVEDKTDPVGSPKTKIKKSFVLVMTISGNSHYILKLKTISLVKV
jgi:hypothetical protein